MTTVTVSYQAHLSALVLLREYAEVLMRGDDDGRLRHVINAIKAMEGGDNG